MDMKDRYEFCKKIESYAKMVAVCLAERMKTEQQLACESVLEHLGIVIEMMLDGTPPRDTVAILVPDSRPLPETSQPPGSDGHSPNDLAFP
jgi:hypothetical protein